MSFRSVSHASTPKRIQLLYRPVEQARQSFVVTRAWNLPKRYLIRSYFEPRVSDRLVSYPQVTQFYIVKREAAPIWQGDSQLITSVKQIGTVGLEPTYFMSTDEIIELPLF